MNVYLVVFAVVPVAFIVGYYAGRAVKSLNHLYQYEQQIRNESIEMIEMSSMQGRNSDEHRCICELYFEMRRAMQKHGDFPTSHHGLGVITEEFWEYVEAMRSDDPEQIRKELTQLGAMALRQLIFEEKKRHEHPSHV